MKIVSKLLHNLDLRLTAQGINLKQTDSLKNHIIDESFDIEYGVRPVKRYIPKILNINYNKNYQR